MTKVQLNQKEQWYADTPEEAEEIVEKAKENKALTMQKITDKYNKYGQYHLVDLTYTYDTPKEVMESRPQNDDAPDGQMSIDEHEGVEYNVEQDGSISVVDGQLSIDEVNEVAEEIETPETSTSEDETKLPF